MMAIKLSTKTVTGAQCSLLAIIPRGMNKSRMLILVANRITLRHSKNDNGSW